jgi:hypothetical protein
MKYQVLGHKRRLQNTDKPYDVICEFESLIQLFAMMDKVDRRKYDGVLVIDTYTNELIASRELEREYTKKRRK